MIRDDLAKMCRRSATPSHVRGAARRRRDALQAAIDKISAALGYVPTTRSPRACRDGDLVRRTFRRK